MSNLIEHARRELQILGEEPQTIEGYLRVIEAFSAMGHSGGSASIAIPTLTRLLEYKNLKPLTNNPAEWEDHSFGAMKLWQNRRNSEAFSEDGGKTYYLLSETVRYGDEQKRMMHTSEDVTVY